MHFTMRAHKRCGASGVKDLQNEKRKKKKSERVITSNFIEIAF